MAEEKEKNSEKTMEEKKKKAEKNSEKKEIKEEKDKIKESSLEKALGKKEKTLEKKDKKPIEEIKKTSEKAKEEFKDEVEEVKEILGEEVEKVTEPEELVEKKIRLTPQERERKETEIRLGGWKPKTKLGKLVKEGKIKKIDEVLKDKILEHEIVDSLLKLKSDLLLIGQAKGKFGGGKRRAWRQTQKKTAEGNIPTFACMVVVGNEDGYLGLGYGKAKETLPARAKALRDAKLNIIEVERGCGSFDCLCKEKHSIPFKVEGKCGSSKVILWPAPQGTGLVIGDECKKILKLAGIKDVYSKTFGQTRTTFNLAKACIEALKKTKLK